MLESFGGVSTVVGGVEHIPLAVTVMPPTTAGFSQESHPMK